MTRAESQANLAYPEDIIDATPLSAYPNWIDRNLPFREGFVKGYEQAEKDLALTQEDIKLITKIHYEIVFMYTTGIKVGDIASEILTRFKQFKEEKK